jgi:uncharacterized protein (TIGR00299 family) protein
MSNLFFDLQNGISGDMAVAALLSLTEDDGKYLMHFIREKLHTFPLTNYDIFSQREKRFGMWGNTFSVRTGEKENKPRDFGQIKDLIVQSGLDKGEKELAVSIFKTLAKAEAKVHGVDVEEVHFHEIGAVDSIVDIVSFAVLYLKLAMTKSFASPIALGHGSTFGLHGPLPLPAPATLEILKGLPVHGTTRSYELTTPTGAAILKNVVSRFGPLPKGTVTGIGLGYGSSNSEGPNALRVLAFDELMDEAGVFSDTVVVVDMTIDDSTPEEIGFLQEELFRTGALEVYVTPVYMKKNRPGFNITVIAGPERFDPIAETILVKSSSFGLRYNFYSRKYLDRKIKKIDTPYGPIRVKVGMLGDRVVKLSPEYEDCRKTAQKQNLPIQTVFDEAKKRAETHLRISKG